MAEENANTVSDPTTNQPASSAGTTPQVQNPPTNDSDVAKMAEELGRYKKAAEDFDEYKKRVEPVLETIWSDQTLYNQVNEFHNKRLGYEAPTEDKVKTDAPPAPDPTVSDLRNSQVNQIVAQFEDKYQLNKLDSEKRKEMNTKIGVMLGEMLDPMGNKTYNQILNDVSLAKLPKYLDNAYFLATKDELIENARNIGHQQASEGATGIIGSIPSGSISENEINLTPKEKQVAQGMGVSEENYLKRKIEILKRQNEPS